MAEGAITLKELCKKEKCKFQIAWDRELGVRRSTMLLSACLGAYLERETAVLLHYEVYVFYIK